MERVGYRDKNYPAMDTLTHDVLANSMESYKTLGFQRQKEEEDVLRREMQFYKHKLGMISGNELNVSEHESIGMDRILLEKLKSGFGKFRELPSTRRIEFNENFCMEKKGAPNSLESAAEVLGSMLSSKGADIESSVKKCSLADQEEKNQPFNVEHGQQNNVKENEKSEYNLEKSKKQSDSNAPPSPIRFGALESNCVVDGEEKYGQKDCSVLRDVSDWMLAEKKRRKTTPPSPDTTSLNQFTFTQSQQQMFQLHENMQETLEKTPRRTAEANLHNTPIRMSATEATPDRRSPSIHTERQEVNRVGLAPPSEREIIEELYRRGVKKQLFMGPTDPAADHWNRPLGPEDQMLFRDRMELENRGYSCYVPYSPRKRIHDSNEERFGNIDGAELAHILSRVIRQERPENNRPRDPCRCGCDENVGRPMKRRRYDSERDRNEAYVRQLQSDIGKLQSQLKQPEPERKSSNCTCAVMERNFLEMAECAYKSVRRQDCSPEGFEQFKRELTQTNDVLKEAMDILKNIKEFCEHKSSCER